jgi:hypothetical protein
MRRYGLLPAILSGRNRAAQLTDSPRVRRQVEADPSLLRQRASLRSEQDIERMTGRSNIVSKVLSLWMVFLGNSLAAQRSISRATKMPKSLNN